MSPSDLYSLHMRSRLFFGSVLTHWVLPAMSMAMAVGFLAGCDGGTHLRGVVLDPNDMPISGADVTLATGTLKREIKSSDRGLFKIGMTHSPWNPELTLSITKPGYKTYEKHFHAKEHLEAIVANLEPEGRLVL